MGKLSSRHGRGNKMPARRTDLDDNKEHIIDLYMNQKLSTRQVGEEMGASAGTIERRLNAWNVPLRLSGRPDLNEHAFDELTPESLYWIGYMAGDGCVQKINKSYRIQLGSKDREQLLKFKVFLSSDQDVKMDYNKNWMIRVSSKHMGERLVSYGIVPRKSLILNMDNKFTNSKEFLRGIIDSDGSFGAYPKRYSYNLSVHTGSVIFANQIKDALTGICKSYEAKIYKNHNGYNVCVNQKRELSRCLNILYDEAPFLCRLERKYKKAKEIQKWLS